MQPVRCRDCGNEVLVEKFSPEHTSVQWTTTAGSVCAEFAAQIAKGASSASIPTCPRLRESIDQAVVDGHVDVRLP